jgi:acetyl esterase/lipase
MRSAEAFVARVAAVPGAEVVRVSSTATLRIQRPATTAATTGPHPAFFWVHGGGYVAGSAALNDRALRRIGRRLGALVASIDYRLAPEHPYPAALDDCYEGLRWLAACDDVDPGRILIAGKSAGGGLSAALTARCLDTRLLDPAGQILIYPMLDDRTVARCSLSASRGWTPEDNAFGWRAYLGCEPGADNVPADAAPARRQDLTGLPPTWIGVGADDLFHDEDVAYARRLQMAGVSTQLEVVPGGFHGFDVVGARTSAARQFSESQFEAMRRFIAQ